VVGAGPVGLLLTALLQSVEGFSVRLYEKRHEYTRTRMVQLAPYLVADSVESYRTDYIDGDSVEAIFDPAELDEGLAFRQSIPSDLMALLRGWTSGFCPLNSIELEVSDLIDARGSSALQRTAAVVTAKDAMAMLEPGDVLIDCTGARSLLRDHLVPGSEEIDGDANTLLIRLEYALVITFLYGQKYDCDEYCNIDVEGVRSFLVEECVVRDGTLTNRTTGRRVSAIVPAYDRAVAEVLKDVVAWTNDLAKPA